MKNECERMLRKGDGRMTVFLVVSAFCLISLQSFIPAQYDEQPVQLFKRAEVLHDQKSDSALLLYQKSMTIFRSQDNVSGVIECHISISDVYKNKGHYHSAFDELWDAQLLAEQIQDTLSLSKIYRNLGSLYSIYQRYEEAISHFQTALTLTKRMVEVGELRFSDVNSIYYSFAVTNRKLGDYRRALAYLDSCQEIRVAHNLPETNTPFMDAETGIIYLKMGELEVAKSHLERANNYFLSSGHSYSVTTCLFLADVYAEEGKWRKANRYYAQSLSSQEQTNVHGDMKVEILKKLADSYKQLKKLDSAYLYQGEAIAITDSLFNAKTAINNQLFRIRDKHDEKIRAKDQFIAQQNQIIERNQIIASRLKLLIGFLLFAVIVTAVILRMRKNLRKSRLAQEQIRIQAEHDREKSQAIMEVKSRELTANTLQMIEKDRIVEELLQVLKKESPGDYRAINSRVSRGNKDMWERFNKRFIEVDTRFYDRLRERHPDLSPTEHRHCALIKLNFDSKEMASLLGISVNSVHISRHRIRKKMRLERDDNLTNHIAEI